jgi:DoxX-like family
MAPKKDNGRLMPTEVHTTVVSKKALWAGRIIGALPVLMLVFSGVMKLLKPPPVVEEFGRLGYPEKLSLALGIIELGCTVIYLIPQTAVLGAILLTAYLGGATTTHLRIGDPFFFPIVLGILIWLGLYLRDLRLRSLVPLTRG